MSHRKHFQITGSMLLSLYRDSVRLTYDVIEGGLPPDARIVDVEFRPEMDKLLVTVESEHFDEAPDDYPYPEVVPLIRLVLYPDRATTGASAN